MKRAVIFALVMCAALLTSVGLAQAQNKSHSVTIRGMAFQPAQLQVSVGDTVVWTNKDDRDYNVVARDGSFKSDNLGKGDTFKHTFTKPGKFAYGCSYHPRMKAVIVVEN